MLGTASIDDRVTGIDASEVLPLAGSTLADGRRSEVDAAALDKQIDQQRKDWKKAHPKAAPGTGPFPWHSTVSVFRDGAPVPQRLRVTFKDGSHQELRWDDDRRWARFEFTAPSAVVSAELDPEQVVYLDANKLNDSRTTQPDGVASRRWSADFSAAVQAFFALVVSL
jgi:hypothetical protein